MDQICDQRLPQTGDTLILTDGRRFLIDVTHRGLRGAWFKATAQDGSCLLQGNLQLRWDAHTGAWRPQAAPAMRSTRAIPPSMLKVARPAQRQID